MTEPAAPRPPFAGIGKRNIAYLVFVLLLVMPTDQRGLDPAGRGMAQGFVVLAWLAVTLPFALWNLVALLGAGGALRKPALALGLAIGSGLAGCMMDLP